MTRRSLVRKTLARVRLELGGCPEPALWAERGGWCAEQRACQVCSPGTGWRKQRSETLSPQTPGRGGSSVPQR